MIRARWLSAFHGRPTQILPLQKPVVEDADEEEERVCRFCWQPEDGERGGELLSPCRCSGSIRFIHRRCLGSWQRTLRNQGCLRKSFRERYRVPRAPFSGAKFFGGKLPTVDEAKDLMFSFIGNPAWQVIMDVWKIVMLTNGIFRGLVRGFQGFETGARFGIDKLKWYINSVTACGPVLLVLGSLCTSLQLPALMLTILSTAAISAQMLIAAIIGFYCGALIGFGHGAWQIFKGTLCVTRTVCCSGAGAVVVAFGSTFKKSFGILGNLIPFLQSLITAQRL